jgi:hypothetical protein
VDRAGQVIPLERALGQLALEEADGLVELDTEGAGLSVRHRCVGKVWDSGRFGVAPLAVHLVAAVRQELSAAPEAANRACCERADARL